MWVKRIPTRVPYHPPPRCRQCHDTLAESRIVLAAMPGVRIDGFGGETVLLLDEQGPGPAMMRSTAVNPIDLFARPWRVLTAWVLIAGFLLQPVLAYLVTPVLTHDVKGQQVAVCTLQGEKVVTLDIPQLSGEQQTEHCSALKLYQMAGAAQVAEPPVVPPIALYIVQWSDQTAEIAHHSLHFSAYPARAPPAFS